jgi:hypothetical protein
MVKVEEYFNGATASPDGHRFAAKHSRKGGETLLAIEK